MSARKASRESWNRYWEHGFLTSCRNAFEANYEGSLKAAWEEFLAALPPGTRVLDICTGNGAIAMIAVEVSRREGLGLEVHGCDSASIRPRETVRESRALLEDVRFHPDTPAEATQFPDAHFGALTGQYAFEYTDEEACIAELVRISAPGARLQLVIHHHRSIVIDTSREELVNAGLIFDGTRLFDHAEAMIRIVGGTSGPEARRALAADSAAEECRARLNEAAARISAAAGDSPNPQLLQMALARVAEAYRAVGESGMEAALSLLATARDQIRANAERLEDLMAAARDEGDLRRIAGRMSAAGLACEAPEEIRHEGGPLMGWLLRARRGT